MSDEENNTIPRYYNSRYLYVNDDYLMVNGVFKDNPFHRQYKMTRIAGYLMSHTEEAKGKIRNLMGHTGYSRYRDQVVDDVYGYAMDFYSQHDDKDFRPNYHNTSDYEVGNYIDIALRNVIASYNQKKLKGKKTKEDNIVDDNETGERTSLKGTVSSRNFEAEESQTSRVELEYFYECFDYLMVIVGNTKPKYKKLTPEMVFDVFLSGFDRVNMRRKLTQREGYYELDDEYYRYLEAKYKLSKEQVVAWMKRIKKGEDNEPFREMLQELVIPLREGNFFREDIVGFQFDE